MYFSIFNATFNINDRKLKNNIGEYSHKKLFLEKSAQVLSQTALNFP